MSNSSDETGTSLGQVTSSLAIPIRALVCTNLIVKSRTLRRALTAPFLAGIIIWLVSSILLFNFKYELIGLLYPVEHSWWMSLLLGLISLIIGFITAPIAIIATAEYLLDGFILEASSLLHPNVRIKTAQPMWKSWVRSIGIAIIKIVILVLLGIIGLFSLVIPGLGIVWLICTALFASLDALSTVALVRGESITSTVRLLKQNGFHLLVLGLFLTALYTVPILNLFTPYIGYMLAADYRGALLAIRKEDTKEEKFKKIGV